MLINKKGLVGMIITMVLVVILAIGTLIYFQIKSNGIHISSGNIIVDVKFNDSDKITGDVIEGFNGTIDISNSTGNKSKVNSNISGNITISQQN